MYEICEHDAVLTQILPFTLRSETNTPPKTFALVTDDAVLNEVYAVIECLVSKRYVKFSDRDYTGSEAADVCSCPYPASFLLSHIHGSRK